jgi:hypothetical protein
MNPSLTGTLRASLMLLAPLAVALTGCTAAPQPTNAEDTASNQADIARDDAISRAEEWVAVKLHYCQSANHERDYDTSCSSICERYDDAAWNPYRSDCSGLVSWAWGLPAPGRVTTEFAPFETDITHTIDASSLEPGDAVNNSDHVMLFKEWVVQDHEATFIEEPGCSSPTPYAHEFTSDVSISGSSIYVPYNGMTFNAIRYDGISSSPPPPSGKPTEKIPPASSDCGVIHPGQGLGPGDTAHSCDGRFELAMQKDGNLVLYEGGKALWATGTDGKNGYAMWMQTDGNLVLYSPYGFPLWSSKTDDHPGAYLALQDDGNLVIYGGKEALWSSNTTVATAAPPPPPKPAEAIPPAPTACGLVDANHGLGPNDEVKSCDGRFDLIMQDDGNLVMYEGKTALWATGTNGKGGYAMWMQADGNLVVYTSAAAPIWDSKTNGDDGAYLAVQNDGNVVIYKSGKPLWASNTSGH